MICTRCQGQNEDNVNFCVHCGAPLRNICPNCGTANTAGARFCTNCGRSFVMAPPPPPVTSPFVPPPAPAPVQYVPQPVVTVPYVVMTPQQKRSKWVPWLMVGIVFLLCGCLYWSMLIPVPLPRGTSPVANVQREARIVQENLPRPQRVAELPVLTGIKEPPKPIPINNAGEVVEVALPAACSRGIELEVTNATERHIFTIAEPFGNGPMTYSMKTRGGAQLDDEYGYHAQWTVYKDGKTEVIRDNHWFSCTWGNDTISCTGPNWREYDSAELCIYSEDPACLLPLQCFPFEGQDPFPQPEENLCEVPASFRFISVNVEGNREDIWWFGTGGVAVPENKYILVTEGAVNNVSFCVPADDKYMKCTGLPLNSGNATGKINWSLYQVPTNACPKPVASGSIDANNRQTPAVSCGPTDGWVFEAAGAAAPGSLPPEWIWMNFGDIDLTEADEYYVAYDSDGDQGTYDCQTIPPDMIKCKGPNADEYNTIKYKIFHRGCGKLVFSSTWPEVVYGLGPAQDRCGLFDGASMSIVYLDWIPGAPLSFYFKMPGGVPGLEKNISGDNDSWEYTARIGDYESSNCSYQGYEGRLYCSISLPSDYSMAVRPLTLHVNGCDVPIYSDQTADLPGIVAQPGGGSSSSGGSSGCGAAPSDTSSGDYVSWCSCMGGVFDPYDNHCSFDSEPGISCSSSLDAASCAAAGGTYTTMPGFCDPGPCPSHCSCP